jgi:hypothetical protein
MDLWNIELVVALWLIFLLWIPHGPVVLIAEGGNDFLNVLFTKPVQIAAGIYAFVRGCDKITKRWEERQRRPT